MATVPTDSAIPLFGGRLQMVAAIAAAMAVAGLAFHAMNHLLGETHPTDVLAAFRQLPYWRPLGSPH